MLSIFCAFGMSANIEIDNPLNELPPRSSREAAKYSTWEMLLKTSVDKKGNVDYKKIRRNEKVFNLVLKSLSSTRIDKTWTENEKIAFWINVYNAFTIKLIIDNYPVSSIKDIKKPWDKEFFSINGEKMSLGHVEHQILRKQFVEPRIHFAINCASSSCPRIVQIPYTSKNLDRLLDRQAKEYINNPVLNNVNHNNYELSKLFQWFAKDFRKSEGSVKNFINKYSKVKIKDQVSKGFLDYNWDLNTK